MFVSECIYLCIMYLLLIYCIVLYAYIHIYITMYFFLLNVCLPIVRDEAKRGRSGYLSSLVVQKKEKEMKSLRCLYMYDVYYD